MLKKAAKPVNERDLTFTAADFRRVRDMLIPYAVSLIIAAATHTASPASAMPESLSVPVVLFLLVVFSEMLCARFAGALYETLLPRQRHGIVRQLTA